MCLLHVTLCDSTILADATYGALGSVINKYKCINGLGYYTYTDFSYKQIQMYKWFGILHIH